MLGNETMTGLAENEKTESRRQIGNNAEDMELYSNGKRHFYLQNIFLSAIKQEDDTMVKRSGQVGQRMKDFQHYCATHSVVTGT